MVVIPFVFGIIVSVGAILLTVFARGATNRFRIRAEDLGMRQSRFTVLNTRLESGGGIILGIYIIFASFHPTPNT